MIDHRLQATSNVNTCTESRATRLRIKTHRLYDAIAIPYKDLSRTLLSHWVFHRTKEVMRAANYFCKVMHLQVNPLKKQRMEET